MEYYLWIKVLHILAFTSWMAGVFYLPRLFVYHIENNDVKEYVKIIKIQEEKLLKIITLPAMWTTIFSGSFMLYLNESLILNAWMHMKIFFALLLIIYTFSLSFYKKQLQNGICKKTGRFFRIYNEVSIILMTFIVVSVVIKPFS